MLFHQALPGNIAYGMNACLNINHVLSNLKLLLQLIFIYKNQKRSCNIFIVFLLLKKKTKLQYLLQPLVSRLKTIEYIHTKQSDRIAAVMVKLRNIGNLLANYVYFDLN